MDLVALWFLMTAFLATIVSTVVGFGSALILIGISSLFFGIKWSIAVTTYLYLYNTAVKSWMFRRDINWVLTRKMLITSVPCVFAGALFLVSQPSGFIYVLLAFVCLIYLAADLSGVLKQYVPGPKTISATGGIYGFLSGAAGTGSIIKAMIFRQLSLEKEAFVATMAITALVLNVIKVAVFTHQRLVSSSDIPLILCLLVTSWAGVWFGKKILASLSSGWFSSLVRIMLAVVAVNLLVKGLGG